MQLTYALDANDYVQFYLYNASINEKIKKKRENTRILLTAFYVVLGCISLSNDKAGFGYFCLIFGFLVFFYYPIHFRRKYIRHYKNNVEENYKNNFGQISTIDFTEDFIEATDRTATTKIIKTEIERISETGQYFFIRTKSGQNLIIPKYKIEQPGIVREELKKMGELSNAHFIENLNWQWK